MTGMPANPVLPLKAPLKKAHDTVGYLAALHGWKGGPDQAVDAEGDQGCPDERAHLIW